MDSVKETPNCTPVFLRTQEVGSPNPGLSLTIPALSCMDMAASNEASVLLPAVVTPEDSVPNAPAQHDFHIKMRSLPPAQSCSPHPPVILEGSEEAGA